MGQLFEQSVLSKLPDRYKSHLKQSVISEEDDMGNASIAVLDTMTDLINSNFLICKVLF